MENFYAGQPVLGRDFDSEEWKYDIFSHYREDKTYECISTFWKQCIPFLGNEHLVGKTCKPEISPFFSFIKSVVVFEWGTRKEVHIARLVNYQPSTKTLVFNHVYNVSNSTFFTDFSTIAMADEIGGIRNANMVECSMYSLLWER